MKQHGFPKSARLRVRSEFERVFSKGRRFSTAYCGVYVLSDPASNEKKVGFAVSRKVGSAVARNALKRRFREILRRHLPQIRPGTQLVLIARPGASAVPYHELEATIIGTLREGGLHT